MYACVGTRLGRSTCNQAEIRGRSRGAKTCRKLSDRRSASWAAGRPIRQRDQAPRAHRKSRHPRRLRVRWRAHPSGRAGGEVGQQGSGRRLREVRTSPRRSRRPPFPQKGAVHCKSILGMPLPPANQRSKCPGVHSSARGYKRCHQP